MNYLYLSRVTISIFVIIIKLNVLLVTSELVSIQKSDPSDGREYEDGANFAEFNSMYGISIDEELLRQDGYCSGRCDGLEPSRSTWIGHNLSHPNTCPGKIHFCQLKAKSERREAAKKTIIDTVGSRPINLSGYLSRLETSRKLQQVLDHTGNICKCVCERTYDPNPSNIPKLLDSFCTDPVSAGDGYVITGLRFKRHGNVMFLEPKEGKLSEGIIDSTTSNWKTSSYCKSPTKVIGNFINKGYSCLKLILEDMILPENAVLTEPLSWYILTGIFCRLQLQ
ncbi:uncharacterized protein LOC130673448 [Microplitis mediator]|uniref:uncharacterized protein LOC130673448 n=1 Tax=Microplitis mediator TaxID=375433 RepID=UPI0025544AFB|nr:uncharacterized protein LOC130673448 [Microplitis mediator]